MPNATLTELLARSLRTRKLYRFAVGVVAMIAAAVVFHIEYDPPLSLEECQFLGVALAFVALGIYAWVRALRAPDPAALAVGDRVVWLYLRSEVRRNYDVMIGTADGYLVPLQIDRGGVEPSREQLDLIFGEFARMHPHAVIGFSPEMKARFSANPRAFGRVPLPATGPGPVSRHFMFWVASSIAIAVVVGFAGMKIVRAIDPGRDAAPQTSSRW